MQNFIKTIINAIKVWIDSRIKGSTADWNESNKNADSYIKNKPDVVLQRDFNKTASKMQDDIINAQATADNAQTIANNAQTAADNAQATANNAQTTADSAQATANNKMDAANPVGTGSFSMNRKSGTFVGYSSHAEGRDTTASGDYSHAEGSMTIASGNNAHAEGYSAKASGFHSHAEGISTTASGDYSHAEGGTTTASGDNSHAEGNFTTASGNCSHAEGFVTTAVGRSQHVQGEYNVLDTATRAYHRAKYAHIVGNGTSEKARSNAHTLDWDGNANFAGDVYVGNANENKAGNKLATEHFVTNKIAEAQLSGGNTDIDLSGYATKEDLATVDDRVVIVEDWQANFVEVSEEEINALFA